MALSVPTVEDPRTQQALNRIARQFPLKNQHLSEEVITVNKIVEGTITGDRIEGGTITGDLIAAGTIEGTNIKGATITGSLIKGETIEGAHLKAGTITAAQIEAGSITATELDVSKLSAISADLGDITAGTITGTTITGGLIRTAAEGARVEIDAEGIRGINAAAAEKFNFDTTTGILTATAVISSESGSAIDTEHLAGQITETQIEDDAISTPKLQANSVTADEISVANLSAITADLGTITAGTLTGTTFQTSASNPRVFLDAEGFHATDAGSSEITVDSDGLKFPGGTGIISRISWGPPTGELGAIYGHDAGPSAQVVVSANHDFTQQSGTLALQALDEASDTAALLVTSHPQEKKVWAEGVPESGGSGEAGNQTIFMDDEGRSDFLQLTETAKRIMNSGEGEVTFPGGSKYSNSVNVTHGLGVTPSQKDIQLTQQGGSDHLFWTNGAPGATTFAVRASNIYGNLPGAGSKFKFNWFIFG